MRERQQGAGGLSSIRNGEQGHNSGAGIRFATGFLRRLSGTLKGVDERSIGGALNGASKGKRGGQGGVADSSSRSVSPHLVPCLGMLPSDMAVSLSLCDGEGSLGHD